MKGFTMHMTMFDQIFGYHNPAIQQLESFVRESVEMSSITRRCLLKCAPKSFELNIGTRGGIAQAIPYRGNVPDRIVEIDEFPIGKKYRIACRPMFYYLEIQHALESLMNAKNTMSSYIGKPLAREEDTQTFKLMADKRNLDDHVLDTASYAEIESFITDDTQCIVMSEKLFNVLGEDLAIEQSGGQWQNWKMNWANWEDRGQRINAGYINYNDRIIPIHESNACIAEHIYFLNKPSKTGVITEYIQPSIRVIDEPSKLKAGFVGYIEENIEIFDNFGTIVKTKQSFEEYDDKWQKAWDSIWAERINQGKLHLS